MEQQQPVRTPESNKAIKGVSGVMAAIGAATLGVMMFLSVADVIGRKFFLSPVEGTAEMVGIMLVIAASMGMGYCALIKAHLRIGIIIDRFSPRGKAGIDVFSYLVCVAAGFIITWQSSLRMWEYIFKQFGGRTAIVSLPYWPFMAVMIIGFTWLTFIMFLHLIDSIKEVIKR